jgi:hypothetical protein
LNKKKGPGEDGSGGVPGIPVSRAMAIEESKTNEEASASGLVKGQTLFQMM